ncbi:uncharacterized protein [Ptychodera flava]|uniref:uncharacterized protein n=1 Tax=Ptychodera flava TaxID=63121 RepID=UPI003969FEA9
MQNRVDNIEDEMSEFREQLKQNTTKMTEMEANPSTFAGLKTTLDELREENNQLKRANDDLENRGRRNNLVFYGIEQDGTNESWDTSEKKVKSVLKNNLEITEDIEFERVHRITNAPLIRGARPIIAMFVKFKDKSNVLRNANKLKNSNISISEDFSKRMRNIRSKLLMFRRSLLEENPALKTFIRYDKLTCINEEGTKQFIKLMKIPEKFAQ